MSDTTRHSICKLTKYVVYSTVLVLHISEILLPVKVQIFISVRTFISDVLVQYVHYLRSTNLYVDIFSLNYVVQESTPNLTDPERIKRCLHSLHSTTLCTAVATIGHGRQSPPIHIASFNQTFGILLQLQYFYCDSILTLLNL